MTQAQGRAIVATQACAGLASVALPLLLARYMAVSDYATLIFIQASASLLAVISGLGMDRVAYRFIPSLALASRQRDVTLLVMRAMSLRLLMLMIAGAVILGGWFLRDGQSEIQRSQWPWVLALALAINLSELAGAALQSVFRPLPLAKASVAVAITRVIVATALAMGSGISLTDGLVLLLGGEIILALVCIVNIQVPFTNITAGESFLPAPTTAALLRTGLANYGAYLLGLLWAGSTMRLIVGAVSPVQATAAYGFFQTLADRGRTYLPVAFMQRQVEPQWSADFDRRGKVTRFMAVAGLLAKLQFYCLGTVAVLVCSAGSWLIGVLVRPEYSMYSSLALLIILQQCTAGYSTMLWMGANASHSTGVLTKAMLLTSVAGAGLLWFTADHGGANGVVLVSCLPPACIAAYIYWAGRADLVRSILRPIPLMQLSWLIGLLLLTNTFANELPSIYSALLAPAVYVIGVSAIAKFSHQPILLKNEWLIFSIYLLKRRK